MTNYKDQAVASVANTLRAQHTSERPRWTRVLSGNIGVSLTVRLSADCVVLGRRVSQDNRDAHHGGHDE